eukprot:TRINITY_DN5451_c0_g1_i1.p1 TRINITY_DN5451_c0_g1~~TRINITY_DN5451_c0_g1_i1.p1  ORF type:complete len:248 (+),score=25.04 TRINITY_DN5451_c0_g1_i1:41-784(+)
MRAARLRAYGKRFAEATSLVIGVGNHAFPRSRLSVGLRVLDAVARKYNQEWRFVPSLIGDIMSFRSILFYRPRTYLEGDIGIGAREITKELGVGMDRTTIVHYDYFLQVGNVRTLTGAPDETDDPEDNALGEGSNKSLSSIFAHCGKAVDKRIAVGIGKINPEDQPQPLFESLVNYDFGVRSRKKYEYDGVFGNTHDLFLRNLFPDEDRVLAEVGINKAVEQVETLFMGKKMREEAAEKAAGNLNTL